MADSKKPDKTEEVNTDVVNNKEQVKEKAQDKEVNNSQFTIQNSQLRMKFLRGISKKIYNLRKTKFFITHCELCIMNCTLLKVFL